MTRILVTSVVLSSLLGAWQQPEPAVSPAPVPESPAIEKVDVRPLAPADLTTPYASPRDAARHRFQAVMGEIGTRRDVRQGLRELAEAYAADPTYALAAYNLGLLCAVAGKWQDAVAALTEAVRLDEKQYGSVSPQLERLRLIAKLESTPEGQRTRRYDESLYVLLKTRDKMSQPDLAAALVQIGRIDPKRVEAPMLLAGLLGDGGNYEAARKFLEIASVSASDPALKTALERAKAEAQRELEFTRARTDAEIASEKGEFDKAAQLFESAWKIIPARADSGMMAASAFLLTDNTSGATNVLHRLRQSPQKDLSAAAGAMLKELAAIEPAAKADSGSAAGEFFRNGGSADPVLISKMLPAVDQKQMELLARPLPRMVLDPASVTLLEGLSADRPADALAPVLPALPATRIAGDRPWAEAQQLIASMKATANVQPVAATERERQSAEFGTAKVKRAVAVDTVPAGATISLNDAPDVVCTSPCDLKMAPGTYLVKAALDGHEPQITEVKVGTAQTAVNLTLEPFRGRVLLQGPETATWEVNGQPISARAPSEIALLPGLHRIAAKSGEQHFEQTVNVRSQARLRIQFAR